MQKKFGQKFFLHFCLFFGSLVFFLSFLVFLQKKMFFLGNYYKKFPPPREFFPGGRGVPVNIWFSKVNSPSEELFCFFEKLYLERHHERERGSELSDRISKDIFPLPQIKDFLSKIFCGASPWKKKEGNQEDYLYWYGLIQNWLYRSWGRN